MEKLKILLILATMFIAGCSPNLTDMEKSDLMVEAGTIKNSLCYGNGVKFFNLYKDLLETGDSKTEKELRKLLNEGWAEKQTLEVAERMGGATEEVDNLVMRAKKIAKEIDFYNLADMGGIAELMESQSDFLWDCKMQ